MDSREPGIPDRCFQINAVHVRLQKAHMLEHLS